MNLHKNYRKMLALILALAITVSGVIVNFPVEDGKVVQFGGEVEAAANTWQVKTPRSSRYIFNGSTAVNIGGKIYVYGGSEYTYSFYYNPQLSIYDPALDSWTHLDVSGPEARTDHIATVINGKMYISGGHNKNSLRDTWMYDPTTNTWEQKANIEFDIVCASAVVINGG